MQTMRFSDGPWCPWHVEVLPAGGDRVLMLGFGRWRWLIDLPIHGRPDAAPLIVSCPRWRSHVRAAWTSWQEQRRRRDRQRDDA